MTDNITLNSGSGGATLATDDIGGTHYQVVKLAWGALDAANLVADTAGGRLPVKVAEALPAGSNGIGSVDVDSIPGTAGEGSALPSSFVVVAGDDGTDTHPLQQNAAGDLKVSLDSETVAATQSGTWETDQSLTPGGLTVKFAVVNASSSGDNTIVSAVGGKKIRVLSLVLVASAATTVEWQSATAGSLSGGMQLAANGGYSMSSDYGLFETTAGEALQLNLSAANSIDGHISYCEV